MASSDVAIFAGFVTFFLLLGAAAPYLNAEFNSRLNDNNYDSIDQTTAASQSVDFADVLLSMITIFFWSFGNIPFLIDIIVFLPARLIMLFMLVRLIRGVGG